MSLNANSPIRRSELNLMNFLSKGLDASRELYRSPTEASTTDQSAKTTLSNEAVSSQLYQQQQKNSNSTAKLDSSIDEEQTNETIQENMKKSTDVEMIVRQVPNEITVGVTPVNKLTSNKADDDDLLTMEAKQQVVLRRLISTDHQQANDQVVRNSSYRHGICSAYIYSDSKQDDDEVLQQQRNKTKRLSTGLKKLGSLYKTFEDDVDTQTASWKAHNKFDYESSSSSEFKSDDCIKSEVNSMANNSIVDNKKAIFEQKFTMTAGAPLDSNKRVYNSTSSMDLTKDNNTNNNKSSSGSSRVRGMFNSTSISNLVTLQNSPFEQHARQTSVNSNVEQQTAVFSLRSDPNGDSNSNLSETTSTATTRQPSSNAIMFVQQNITLKRMQQIRLHLGVAKADDSLQMKTSQEPCHDDLTRSMHVESNNIASQLNKVKSLSKNWEILANKPDTKPIVNPKQNQAHVNKLRLTTDDSEAYKDEGFETQSNGSTNSNDALSNERGTVEDRVMSQTPNSKSTISQQLTPIELNGPSTTSPIRVSIDEISNGKQQPDLVNDSSSNKKQILNNFLVKKSPSNELKASQSQFGIVDQLKNKSASTSALLLFENNKAKKVLKQQQQPSSPTATTQLFFGANYKHGSNSKTKEAITTSLPVTPTDPPPNKQRSLIKNVSNISLSINCSTQNSNATTAQQSLMFVNQSNNNEQISTKKPSVFDRLSKNIKKQHDVH
jgi:hypothetical protein